MYSLLIETSTEQGLLAFYRDHQPVFLGNLPPGALNSKNLLPEIHRGLAQLGLKVKDLTYIAAGVGPGSYTGIRVGVITAKTLAFAANLPLIGLCTLELWTPAQEGAFAVLIDAKIGGAYATLGQLQHGNIVYLSAPQLVPLEKLKNHLQNIQTLLTPKKSPLDEKLARLYPEAAWQWEEKAPDSHRMNALAWEKFKAGQGELNLDILYLRKTQAEIDLQTP